jgi:YD repeat-containing protein
MLSRSTSANGSAGYVLSLLLGLVGFATQPDARAQQTPVTVLFTLFPYDGNQVINGIPVPRDVTKIAYGVSPADLCAKRTEPEVIGPFTAQKPIMFVGIVAQSVGACGFIWDNLGIGVSTPGPSTLATFQGTPVSCTGLGLLPAGAPTPPQCSRVGSPKDAGPPCPACGNPVNPGTGNKFQAETDLQEPGAGSLSLTRYYNSALEAYDGRLGGHWQHTYTRRLLTDAGTHATYYQADGKQLVFTLQTGAWVGDADVPDILTEFKDSNQIPTGWTLRRAANDDLESYDASGNLVAIQTRNGLTQSLTYTDGTNGATSGNGGFVLDAAGNPTTAVLQLGLLLRVADNFGRTLTFGYDQFSHIVKITDPAGGVFLYGYSAQTSLTNLTSVTYPDGHQRTYQYNESAQTGGANLPYALTGITDENGARFATFSYDSSGRAIQTVHDAGGSNADRYLLTYTTPGVQTTITDPLGTQRTYGFQATVGVAKNNGITQPSASGIGSASSATTYDANGNISSKTDFNGNLTNYSYDLTRDLETSRTEAVGTPQARTISTQWHPIFRLRTKVAEPLRITTYVYNGDGGAQCGFLADNATLVPGVLCSKTIQPTSDTTGTAGFGAMPAGSPRTWTYTYNVNGFVLTADGPRTDLSDITTSTYYAKNDADFGKRGNVATITNALGHVTSIAAYNAHGQPLTIVDPNGMITSLGYDPRLRLISRNVGGEITTYDHDNVGQLTKVTMPDGSSLSYTYDAAHRLTGMFDNLGNRIAYTLDAMGNRTQEQVFDPTNALAQTRSRAYNNLNRLAQEIGAQSQTTLYAYDNQGNVTTVTDPLNHATANQYDALNRLIQVTDPNLWHTLYGYNGIDQLVAVTDPRTLATTYTYDGLSNLNSQRSPDTGTTINTYDAAGNLLTQTDAKLQTTTYTYDALNRVASITFADGSKQNYVYDLNNNGVGRLTSIAELDAGQQAASGIAYAYDLHGRTISETRTIHGVQYTLGYSYDSFGRPSGLTYPSGRSVSYLFDPMGRIAQVNTTPPGGSVQVVAEGIAYQPFGGVRGFSFGNGQSYTRGFDLDGRISAYSLGARTFAVGYDAASRVGFISDTADATNTNTYSYDALDRLTGAVLPGTPFAYSYDAVGNRTSRTVGSSTDTYAYDTASNRLASITSQNGQVRNFVFDANGSTVDDGNNQYGYDSRGRMVRSTGALGTTNYQLNALGQRFRKTNATDDRVFLYDTWGHLIAETDPLGQLKREYLYLGDIPLAVIQ